MIHIGDLERGAEHLCERRSLPLARYSHRRRPLALIRALALPTHSTALLLETRPASHYYSKLDQGDTSIGNEIGSLFLWLFQKLFHT
jgi:hypothetical protein